MQKLACFTKNGTRLHEKVVGDVEVPFMILLKQILQRQLTLL